MPIAVESCEGLQVEQLQSGGHVVCPVSPRIAAPARERYKVASVKDDRFDAFAWWPGRGLGVPARRCGYAGCASCSAPVGEQHDTGGMLRDGQVAVYRAALGDVDGDGSLGHAAALRL
jgi:hypothetical protein